MKTLAYFNVREARWMDGCAVALEASLPTLWSLFSWQGSNDKTNKMTVRPAKTQISLGIRPVWSESSLCTQWVAKGPSFLHADSEDTDQTGRMPRLIWVFAGRTCHFVGFVMRRIKYLTPQYLSSLHSCGASALSLPTMFLISFLALASDEMSIFSNTIFLDDRIISIFCWFAFVWKNVQEDSDNLKEEII